uniref:ANK_REP_REGION domain-containing protein n=1 Tax=Globodera pallida TaxID=36090 RepID=A0A183C994_GLOPA
MIDVCVAVVRLCSEAIDRLENDKFKQRQQQMPPFGPANFDLLMALPSAIGTSKLKKTLALPKCKALHAETGGEAALRFVRGLCRSLRVRAVSVPMANLDHSLPGCSSSTSHFDRPDSPQLILIPITPSEVSSGRVGETFEFCPLASLMHASMNFDSDFVDVRSQNFVMRIGEWLMHRQCQADFGSTSFLNALFLIPPASQRIFHCVHNPSYDPRQLRFCCQSSAAEDKENGPGGKRVPSELDEAVKRSNALRAEMLRMEKYDKFVINPLFGANILCKRQITAPAYFVRNHSSRATGRRGSGGKWAVGTAKKRVQQQRSPTEFWEQQYPLHKHAFDGNADRIRELLAHGNDPNEQDNDLWTPLHYCAFYNRLEACEALLLHPRTNVNVVNGTGATPLHFAALNGNIYVAELILSHQLADINIRDSTGKTPLDLCVLVPKTDWQGVAFLLKQSVPAQLAKMEVQLIGAPSLQVEVDDAEMVTAEELRAKVLQMEGLEPDVGARIFAIWLIDSRLSLQLKAEQNVKVHLDKWTEHLAKFGDDCIVGGSGGGGGGGEGEERARVVLKRDARTLLGDEQMLVRKHFII